MVGWKAKEVLMLLGLAHASKPSSRKHRCAQAVLAQFELHCLIHANGLLMNAEMFAVTKFSGSPSAVAAVPVSAIVVSRYRLCGRRIPTMPPCCGIAGAVFSETAFR